jgi:nucleoside-diphosphate-sugar epimerase
VNTPRALVTGGSGYFGSLLIDDLLAHGYDVRSLDVAPPDGGDSPVDHVVADIRDRQAVTAACKDVDVVFHNVAQVPLARDRELFESVNVGGTAVLLVAARDAGVAKVVHTSSSAVYGIPDRNPVTESSPRRPLESYGRAKLRAEHLCAEAATTGLDVTIVRPRTILGHGRLGIIALVFEQVEAGAPVFVLGRGDNRYQFVHAEDLADACRRAAERAGSTTYNVGARDFGTMRETLQALVDHAATGSRVVGVPMAPAVAGMRALSAVGMAPFAPYHWLLYGRSLWFDTTRAERELGWQPAHGNASMLIESYEWWRAHRDELGAGASAHRSPVRAGALKALRFGRRPRAVQE